MNSKLFRELLAPRKHRRYSGLPFLPLHTIRELARCHMPALLVLLFLNLDLIV
jgi:hypothetical protein